MNGVASSTDDLVATDYAQRDSLQASGYLPIIPPVSDVFEAIATPARRAILDELVERDGQTLFELCNRLAMKHQLGLTRQAISQHLEVLESAGLVTTVRQGKYKLHYFHTAPLETIVARWLKPGKKRRRE